MLRSIRRWQASTPLAHSGPQTPPWRTLQSVLRRTSMAVAFVALLPLGLAWYGTYSGAASSSGYSCAASSCYGTAHWQNSQYTGYSTMISIAHLDCDPTACLAQGGYVNDELWQHSGTSTWFEVGYGTFTDTNGTQVDYFWAGPGSSTNGYLAQPLGVVASNDYGTTQTFTIEPNQPGNLTGLYNLSSAAYSTSDTPATHYDEFDTGLELFGTQGAVAPSADFTQSSWIDSLNNASPQTANGSIHQNAPIQVSWSAPPTTLAGGDLTTSLPTMQSGGGNGGGGGGGGGC